jgi:magnesium chelatase family protein
LHHHCAGSATPEFPARFQLIAAMNPCPCGYLGSPTHACRCTPDQVTATRPSSAGPLLDRIDLHVEVPALPSADLLGAAPGEATEPIRLRSTAARQRALDRQGCSNMALQGQAIDLHVQLDSDAIKFLNVAATRMGWSARSTHRALKVARTIADLAGAEHTQISHLAEAMQYRRQLMVQGCKFRSKQGTKTDLTTKPLGQM